MTEPSPRPTYNPRQLDLVNSILIEELDATRAAVIARLCKEWNIFNLPMEDIKKLAEPDIVLKALQDYVNRKYPVLTICGSIRLGLQFWMDIAKKWTKEGWLIHTVTVWGEHDFLHNDSNGKKVKLMLDDIYKQRIRSSDAVLILNVGIEYKPCGPGEEGFKIIQNGYIGESTRSEFAYAQRLGKKIFFLDESRRP